jgi:cytochrome c oxidase subunit I+III
MGWTWLNLLSSVGSFIMAFGFALFAIDVAMQIWLGQHSRRNPWQAGTLEWAMPIPAPAYNFASLAMVAGREPLHDRPDLAVALARGEGWLGHARNGWRETLAVDMVTGEPDHIVILPGNSGLPIMMAAVLGGFFLSMLAGLYWIAPLFLIGVVLLGWRWAASNGQPRDHGPLRAGPGVALPIAAETHGTTGWWGSVFALAASTTLFASLLFGYAFLWTVAPDWPPPRIVARTILEPLLALVGAAVALLTLRRAIDRQSLLAATLGQAALLVALALLIALRLPPPASHAYAATGAAVAAYGIFHAGLAALILLFVRTQIARGRIGGARQGALRIAKLWSDHGAIAGLLALMVVALPGWLA